MSLFNYRVNTHNTDEFESSNYGCMLLIRENLAKCQATRTVNSGEN